MVTVTVACVSSGHWVEVVEALVRAAEERVMKTWGIEPELHLVSVERAGLAVPSDREDPTIHEYEGVFEIVGKVQ